MGSGGAHLVGAEKAIRRACAIAFGRPQRKGVARLRCAIGSSEWRAFAPLPFPLEAPGLNGADFAPLGAPFQKSNGARFLRVKKALISQPLSRPFCDALGSAGLGILSLLLL